MLHVTKKELQKRIKSLNYKGCKNCIHQIESFRRCEWAERGGDRQIHFICPKWERRNDMDESKVEIEKVIVRDGYKIRVPMQEGAYTSIENKGEHAIWFAFPIDRQGLYEVRPGQVLYLKGRSAHETEFIKKCALEDKYTCINEFKVGNQRIE